MTRAGAMRAASAQARADGRRVGFVPTMGALHEGHLSLVRLARERCDDVAVSVFVNPAQFGPGDDFDAYPRDLARDAALLERMEVRWLFAPDASSMYPAGPRTTVDPGPIGDRLCGAHRPGHFRGVATVVVKLFGIVRPHVAIFGRKDAQQCAVIEQVVRDLDLDVEIVRAATVREPDGLALSSRNAYLSPAERRAAPVVRRALRQGEELVLAGERSGPRVEAAMLAVLGGEPLVASVDYASAVDPGSLEPVSAIGDGDAVLLAAAARIGRTRLIDNVEVRREGVGSSG